MSAEQRHAPEPWRKAPHLPCIEDESGYLVANLDDSVFSPSEDDANAARIVACVNAFEGVDTDAIAELPNAKVSGLLAFAEKARDQVRDTRRRAEKAERQRDELLAALTELRDAWPRLTHGPVKLPPFKRQREMFERVNAVIGKAQS
jgi:hypothetical protein